VLLNV